jgi:alkyl hydroperoxide reductase subunit AhpF
MPGIFAAGDVTTICAEQVPISIGEGAKAGLSAWRYVAADKL